jgi:hypothetical protein
LCICVHRDTQLQNFAEELYNQLKKLSILDVYQSTMPKAQNMLQMYSKPSSPLHGWATIELKHRGSNTTLAEMLLKPVTFPQMIIPMIQRLINVCLAHEEVGLLLVSWLLWLLLL